MKDGTDNMGIVTRCQTRIEAGVPEDIAYEAADAHHEVQRIEARLADAARAVVDTGNSVIGRLTGGYTINSLGELQGRGPALDRECANLDMAGKRHDGLERVIRRGWPTAPIAPTTDETSAARRRAAGKG